MIVRPGSADGGSSAPGRVDWIAQLEATHVVGEDERDVRDDRGDEKSAIRLWSLTATSAPSGPATARSRDGSTSV